LLLVDVGGAGVALESDAPADGDGSAIGLDGGGLELVEDDEVDFIDEDWSEGNLARASDDRRRVTTLDFGCFMLDFEVEVDAAAGDSVVMVRMCFVYGVEVVDEQPRIRGRSRQRAVREVALTVVAVVYLFSCGRRKGWVQCKRPWRAHGGRWR